MDLATKLFSLSFGVEPNKDSLKDLSDILNNAGRSMRFSLKDANHKGVKLTSPPTQFFHSVRGKRPSLTMLTTSNRKPTWQPLANLCSSRGKSLQNRRLNGQSQRKSWKSCSGNVHNWYRLSGREWRERRLHRRMVLKQRRRSKGRRHRS